MSNISHYETRLFKYFLYLLLLSMLPSLNMKASERKSLFDRNWYFYRGDVRNAESPVYNDSAWRKVDLPHDWSIEPLENQEPDKVVGPFSRESVGGFATGQTVKLSLSHRKMPGKDMSYTSKEFITNRKYGSMDRRRIIMSTDTPLSE